MFIYEVKLELINKNIYSSFISWLNPHIKEMLQHKGFLEANLNDTFKENCMITIKYLVQTKNDLNDYIENYSQAMRENGIEEFKDSFKATRKIYKYISTS